MSSDLLKVARVVRPHGLRGRVKVQALSMDHGLAPGVSVYLSREGAPANGRATRVESVAPVRGAFLLLGFEGYASPEAAERLRGSDVWMSREDLPPLAEWSYYHEDLLGLQVETEEGEQLGSLEEILETGAADVYIVRGAQGEVLLPATREVVREVDLDRRRIVVRPLKGMLD